MKKYYWKKQASLTKQASTLHTLFMYDTYLHTCFSLN